MKLTVFRLVDHNFFVRLSSAGTGSGVMGNMRFVVPKGTRETADATEKSL